MLGKNTLRNASYAAAVIIVLALTGIFESFAERLVMGEQLSLSTVFLIGALVGVGYLVAFPLRERDMTTTIVNGVVGALMVGAGITLVVLFSEAMDARFVFPNMGKLLGSPVTFGQTSLIIGILMLLAFSGVSGVLAGILVHLPLRIRDILFISLCLTVVMGILQNQINNVISLTDALSLIVVFAIAYFVTLRFAPDILP
ncbi:MAG TPA: hypothetical protein VHL11_13135, partial [Phototrophicaceae bacterium]|nr:hypothetical protein [Phototrophicaceae bacterium]